MEELLTVFAKANEDEQSAIGKYSHLLGVVAANRHFIPDPTYTTIITRIKQYIAEEMKHSKGLSEIYTLLSGLEAE